MDEGHGLAGGQHIFQGIGDLALALLDLSPKGTGGGVPLFPVLGDDVAVDEVVALPVVDDDGVRDAVDDLLQVLPCEGAGCGLLQKGPSFPRYRIKSLLGE